MLAAKAVLDRHATTVDADLAWQKLPFGKDELMAFSVGSDTMASPQ